MRDRAGRSAVPKVLLVASLLASPPVHPQAGARVALCGRSAASQTQLYFDLAKSPFAEILRADERETILHDRSAGMLWTFVVKPVPLVVCRSDARPAAIETDCGGNATLCAAVGERLRGNPRATP